MIYRLGARCTELDLDSISVWCESQHPLAACSSPPLATLSSITENAKAMLPWIPLLLFSRIPAAQKIHFPHLFAASLYASLSASPPASVGLCNFLSESLPACLHICLPTCLSTSASTVRPQRDNIFLSREKTEETNVFLRCFLLEFHNMIPLIMLMQCVIFLLFHFSPRSPSRRSLPAISCDPSLQAGRKAG